MSPKLELTWYWSVDTLIWQVSIDDNMDVQYQICMYPVNHQERITRSVQLPYKAYVTACLQTGLFLGFFSRNRKRKIGQFRSTLARIGKGKKKWLFCFLIFRCNDDKCKSVLVIGHRDYWGPLNMSPTNFVACSYGKFQPGRLGWNSRNKTKMVERKLVSFAAIVALWTLVTLLIKVIRIHLKWKWIQDNNYAIFAAMLR